MPTDSTRRTFAQVRGLQIHALFAQIGYCQAVPDKLSHSFQEASPPRLAQKVLAVFSEAVGHVPEQTAPILRELAAVAVVRSALDEVVLDLVRAARLKPTSRGQLGYTPARGEPIRRECTWREIGDALDITRQSAHEAYAGRL